MELLNFNMPPFARIVWASKEIKEKWEHRVAIAARIFNILEEQTVIHGLRSCYTTHVHADGMPYISQLMGRKGLHFLPLHKIAPYSGFSHYHPEPRDGEPFAYYGVVSKSIQDATEFSILTNNTGENVNHKGLAKLLGYPECCYNFFDDVWAKRYIDPVWQSAGNSSSENTKKKAEYHIRLRDTIPPQANPLLKYVGLRFVPHIPCSLDCKETIRMANEWLELAVELKLEGTDYLLELLSLPVEWDCLKGIAYVSTPLFKIETNSMTCYPKYVVQKEGTWYPNDAPKGLKFPWSESWKFNGIEMSGCSTKNA